MQVDLTNAFVCFTTVGRGFQRGGSLLGFPTANLTLTPAATRSLRSFAMNTVWCGYAAVDADAVAPAASHEYKPADAAVTAAATTTSAATQVAGIATGPLPARDLQVFPCVFSVGDNPHFKNVELTLEVHILHKFSGDFYAHGVRLLGVAPFRGMTPFTGIDALIAQIHDDIRVAEKQILPRPEVQALRAAAFPESVEQEVAAALATDSPSPQTSSLFSHAVGAPSKMFFEWVEKRGRSVAATL